MPTTTRRWLATAAALAFLAGCSAPADPRLVGDQTELCGNRVPRALAEDAVGRPIQDLLVLGSFDPGRKVGGCSLTDESGAVLDVSVVADPDAELTRLLQELASSANYSGDAISAVAGEGSQSQAYVAVDGGHYVRVLVNTGSSEGQRSAALGLALLVADRSRTLA